MWKYIVTWAIVSTVTVDCFDSNETDEFGRKTNQNITLALHCTKKDYENKSKDFVLKKEALAFYKLALTQQPDSVQVFGFDGKPEYKLLFVFDGNLLNVKIDSVFIEK